MSHKLNVLLLALDRTLDRLRNASDNIKDAKWAVHHALVNHGQGSKQHAFWLDRLATKELEWREALIDYQDAQDDLR
jgi:hypothetical protein